MIFFTRLVRPRKAIQRRIQGVLAQRMSVLHCPPSFGLARRDLKRVVAGIRCYACLGSFDRERACSVNARKEVDLLQVYPYQDYR